MTLLLPRFPDLEPGEQRAVEEDVLRFVAAEIEAMPVFLRLPCAAALHVFFALAWLRHGSRFVHLNPALRAGYVEQWENAPLSAMRDFIRLLRSLALFAYFDHAQVRARLARPPAPPLAVTQGHR